MSLLVRLKPLNERKHHNVKTYMIDGIRFFVERGWYEVSDAIADTLRELHQDHYDLDSPLLFDVCTPAQAEKLENFEEHAAVTAKATARRPASVVNTRRSDESGDMTSADVTGVAVDPPNAVAPTMLDPDPNGEELPDPSTAPVEDEDDGRVLEVGRVTSKSQAPKARMRHRNT
jgi:hypothetical protein